MQAEWTEDDWGYVQIVVVKLCEKDKYLANWPRLNFVFLPESENTFGIGASRFWIMEVAKRICPREFPFAFMMDDNVQAWKAVRMKRKDGKSDGKASCRAAV